ncbi:DUF7118 family protein [Haloarcula salinisoli]|uniref:Uncharacterized protein n=1 Tax=Haloarcula salinisoli TaxID=2487746 RepID=A0A8J7YI59_9EURY|nr:hypothetical protein [Halomicroarcula salinisoli]MBX0286583.1 hypothetical protein [Halomicroarcula salinisoli]MBX0303933.1 hypothetical protein [Halomicroarcula salinisoli]
MTDAAQQLHEAATQRRQARERVEAIGEAQLRRCRELYREFHDLLDRYEDTATGSGNFQAYTEFEGRVANLAEDLDDDLPEKETFEAVDDYLQQRRLSESDFETARRKLDPVGDVVGRLDEWEDSREQYREARRDARKRLGELEDRIDELERLQRMGDADLDAPVEHLREPIVTYDERVQEAFSEFRSSASAREVLSAVARADAYPLVDFQSPPEDLLGYVQRYEAGTEPIPKLLEYADYSASKLDHYVDDTAALKRAVGTRRTYLRTLDADPLTIGWPPPPADHLPWLVQEFRSVLSTFAGEDVVEKLRAVRALARREDYERLRESALARAELAEDERERLASGAVEDELQDAREEKADIEDALAEHGSL